MKHSPSSQTILSTLILSALLLVPFSSAFAQDTLPLPGAQSGDGHTLPSDWYTRPRGVQPGIDMNMRALENPRPIRELRDRPAIGAEVMMVGRNVIVIRDNDGAIRNAGFTSENVWDPIVDLVYNFFGDEFDFVMALTDWDDRRVAAYYRPLANDTLGLGYQRLFGVQVFNGTEQILGTHFDNLEGFIFMNNWRNYLGRFEVLGRVTFLQEIGHRWSAFPYYAGSPADGRDMLGRDDSHWSYFMHTSNSAIEGNTWRDNDNGTFTTRTSAQSLTFSELDLYLMGFLPPEDVNPWFIIHEPDTTGLRDDFGQRLNAASPPAIFGGGSVTLSGTRHDITIDDVIRSEGERSPNFADSQKTWNMLTVMIVSEGNTFSSSDLRNLEDMLDNWEQIFEEETRGAADLVMDIDSDIPIGPSVAFGEACTSSAECDQESATSCIATSDGGQVCSRACTQTADCSNDFCCAEGFCFPPQDDMCDTTPTTCSLDSECDAGFCCSEGACLPPEDPACQTSETSTTTTTTTGPTSGNTGGFVNSSGNGSDDPCGCSSITRPSTPLSPLTFGFSVLLLGGLLTRRTNTTHNR